MAKETVSEPKKISKKDYTYALGRRRRASARVRLHKGTEESTVNGVVIGKYFAGPGESVLWQKPFTLTGTAGKFYLTAKVVGGGKKGQLTAVTHGLSRALSALDREAFRDVLKAAGLLTRDSRKRERRMVGTGGKSRRKKSSPKR